MLTDKFSVKIDVIKKALPALPHHVADLLRLMDRENLNINELSGIIEKDPSLSLNVLRSVNSVYYGVPQKVTSIGHAVELLGMAKIKAICRSGIIGGAINRLAWLIDTLSFWKHSVATALIAGIFSKTFRLKIDEDAYLSGLVHDVGIIVLDRSYHNIYSKVIKLTHDSNIQLCEAEMLTIGVSHATVGGWLMEKWGFSSGLTEAVSKHHSVIDSTDENKTLVALTALSNDIARVKGFGLSGDNSGVMLSETESFRILKGLLPSLDEDLLLRFVLDLDKADSDIRVLAEGMK
jgi:HD-like signal output (HDOD) protein